MSASDQVIMEAVKLAYKGKFIGDAVAMPVHWYYDLPRIKKDFNGWIKQYEKPKDFGHPNCYIRLPDPIELEGDKPPVQLIGDVILHDKRAIWEAREKKPHYHQGLDAGENTLDSQCALLLSKTMHECGPSSSIDDVAKRYISNYVSYMTTPGLTTDTYADGFHRSFFTDWVVANRPTDPDTLYNFAVERAMKMVTKRPPNIGDFCIPTTVVLSEIDKPLDALDQEAKEFFGLSNADVNDDFIEPLGIYTEVLHAVVRGASLKDEAEKALLKILGENGAQNLAEADKSVTESSDKLQALQQLATSKFGVGSGMKDAFPVVLYLARQYHDDFEGGILANVNIGGENCNRGSALGTLLGAAAGATGNGIPSKWITGLKANHKIDAIFGN